MAYWLAGVHILPLWLLPFLSLPAWIKLTIAAMALYSLFDSWRRLIRRNHPETVRSLTWKDADHCRLVLQSGKQLEVTLDTQALILPWLVILHFRTSRRGLRYLPLLADMLDKEVFRLLRVRLRIAMDQGIP